MQKLLNYIGAEFLPAKTGEFLAFQNPYTPQGHYAIASSSPMDVVAAIQTAKKSELKWTKSSAEDRQKLLSTMADCIESHAEGWAKLESEMTGLPETLLFQHVYLYAAKRLRSAAQYNGDARLELNSSPVGTCALFLPWVLSFRIFAERIAPALQAGNTLIVKISEKNPIVGQFIAELLQQVAAPAGVCNVLQGSGEVIGELLGSHPAIAAVDFTGRHQTAEVMLSASAKISKRLRILAGSKNSAVLFDDVDFDVVLPELLRACLIGQGQLAESISRIFVSSKRYVEFIDCLKKQGPLIAKYQQRLISAQNEQLVVKAKEELLAEGAKLLDVHEPNAPGYLPSFFYDVTMCSPYQLDQIHGPVVLINEYKYLHEAEKWVNTGYHGHSAQVWTKDIEKARKFATKLEVGRVWINSWFDQSESTESWSLKASAHGYQGPHGLVEFYNNFTQVYEMRP